MSRSHQMRLLLLASTFFLSALLSLPCAAMQDSLQMKRQLARSYVTHSDVRSKLVSILPGYEKMFPDLQTGALQRLVEQELNWAKIDSSLVDVMVDLYTLSELQLLTDFLLSDVGKSLSGKLPLFKKAFVPILIDEMERCLDEESRKARRDGE